MLEPFLRSIWHKSLGLSAFSDRLRYGLSFCYFPGLFVSLIRPIVALVCFVTRRNLLLSRDAVPENKIIIEREYEPIRFFPEIKGVTRKQAMICKNGIVGLGELMSRYIGSINQEKF